MTRAPRVYIGRDWEDRAARYLIERGLKIVTRGYRCRLGEIDLVCRDGGVLVFVEVRARGSGARVRAAQTIDAAKRRRLVAAARHYLTRHPEWHDRRLRFDVVAIDGIDAAAPTFAWLENVIDC